jgi:glyceraldehyde 3-phosphate dehydrogenase
VTAIAINGLGCVGRTFLKVAMTRHELRVVAVNDLIDPENLVHLLRFDSAYRRYDQPVAYEPGVEPALRVGRTRMRLVTNANRSVFHRRSTVLTS